VAAGRNKTKLIGWHSEDPTLKEWIGEQAAQAGVTIREYLDRLLAKERKRVERQQATTTEGKS
jgi:hypothetical protein